MATLRIEKYDNGTVCVSDKEIAERIIYLVLSPFVANITAIWYSNGPHGIAWGREQHDHILPLECVEYIQEFLKRPVENNTNAKWKKDVLVIHINYGFW